MGRLSEKVALVTGAASGIGAACAVRFANEGASVIGLDVAEPSDAWSEVESAAPGTRFLMGDVRDEATIAECVAEVIEAFGRIDILVNAAGVSCAGAVGDLDAREWDRVLDINLKGTFLVSKYVVRDMAMRGGGSIINVSSVEGIVGFSSQAAYNASKGGVILLTRNMAVDYGAYGVRVNCLCPGLIETPLTAVLHLEELKEIRRRFIAQHMLGRSGQPEEVAGAAFFLASDDASFVTGHSLVVDGGYTAGHRLSD